MYLGTVFVADEAFFLECFTGCRSELRRQFSPNWTLPLGVSSIIRTRTNSPRYPPSSGPFSPFSVLFRLCAYLAYEVAQRRVLIRRVFSTSLGREGKMRLAELAILVPAGHFSRVSAGQGLACGHLGDRQMTVVGASWGKPPHPRHP